MAMLLIKVSYFLSRYKFNYLSQFPSMIHRFPYIYTQSNIFRQVVTGWNTRWATEIHMVLVYHILRQFCCMSSKWPMSVRGHRSTIIPESQISFRFARFRVTCHFETKTLNDPKMTLTTKRSKTPNTQITTPLCYALQQTVFELHVTLREVQRITDGRGEKQGIQWS